MITRGVHHITAIARDAQRNLDFYTGTLGLRLVKRTVNFDDPSTYHFYYGDRTGSPGTLLTFFPWRGVRPGRPGVGQSVVTGFRVPAGSLDFWEDRLGQAGVTGLVRRERFGESALRFSDPEGLGLELVASGAPVPQAPGGGVPHNARIAGIHGSVLSLSGTDSTAALLEQVLGMEPAGEDGEARRFRPKDAATGGLLDLVRDPAASHGTLGAGTVHHIAWRAGDEAEQLRFRGEVLGFGLEVTPVVDRQYFRSIYFREPGGVLFEIATDGPGFLIDEPVETLGEALKLPEQYEPAREAIAAGLPEIVVPA